MTDKVRIKIAAVVTALFLGAACTAGVLTHAHPSTVSAASAARPATVVPAARGGTHPPTNEHENYD
jgi:hypothetical protein